MYIIIVNAVSANGHGLRILEKIKKDPLYLNKDCRVFKTEYEGHAEEIAEQVAKRYASQITSIIAIGGDGTLHEVVNGLKQYPSLSVSFIPAGTGNDFARGCGISGDAVALFRRIITAESSISYWPGSFEIDGMKRAFMNSLGFGFDAEIVKVTNDSKYKKVLNKWKLGSLTYVIALLQVLTSFRPRTIHLEIDGKTHTVEKAWMVTVANHPYYGGGMKILPNATIKPNTFSVLTVNNISHWKVLALFVTVFWGKHINFKEVSVFEASSLVIGSQKPMNYQVDGQSGVCQTSKISKQLPARSVYGAKRENNLLEITS
ncbi:diacylglycerol/lipid kinase family protein [Radiobacillus sp. PE A8.2]|uniref:diacylglycerol/lipid kinase family protein n=1 Tax=Radiobacillus sp. PE A8.2 TaxID=3380349 RepID=UPI00388F1004